MGKALKFLLSPCSGLSVETWGRSPDLPPAEVVFMAVPTAAILETAEKIKNTQGGRTIVVVLSKGLGKKGETPWQLSKDVWQNNQVLISGPMIAEELIAGKPGWGLVGGLNQQAIEKIISLFADTKLHLTRHNDLTGLSWCGPLKNLYAIGLGKAAGGNKGLNFKGRFVSQAILEMAEIIEFFSGEKETAYSLAGIGDLVATGFSPNSSNFSLAKKLAQGKKVSKTSEGVTTARGLNQIIPEKIRHYPILYDIIQTVVNNKIHA